MAHAEDNNKVLPVRPDIRETNANNHLLLLDDSEEDSDERSAHIDGMLDYNGRDDDGNRQNAGMDIADKNNKDNIDAAYHADIGEEDNASPANDNTNAKTKLETTRMLMVAKTMTMLAEITMVAKTLTMLAEITTTNPATNMLATTRMSMGDKTMTKQTTIVMLVRAGPTLTLRTRTRKRTRKERLIRTKTMQMLTLHTKKQKIWTR
jgi:hypothetical protein